MTASDHTIDFAIRGPILRADLPGLCDRVCALLGRPGLSVAFCDVAGIDADAVTVDALARLQLAAGRRGCQVRLRNASDELAALVFFMGLQDILPDEGPGSPDHDQGSASGYDKGGSKRPPARLRPE